MKTFTISVRITEELQERLKGEPNRNKFIVEAIKEKLALGKTELSEPEKKMALKGAKNLNDVMQELILQEAARRKNFLEQIDNETFAKLVASRLPKEDRTDGELEADVLSLKSCLERMPEIPDLTQELNRVKGDLFKAERERDLNKALLEHGKGAKELGELMGLVYRSAVEYAVDLVARRNLPGFGDGRGISDRGYADIAELVKDELEKLEVYRRKVR